MKKLNLPNKLTVFRFCMVPVFIIVMYFFPSDGWLWMLRNALGALIFLAASITDAVDGHIARKYNLITDFGKFLDPLADKFIVISAMTMIFYLFNNIRSYFIWLYIVVLLREFAVTGLRLIVSREGVVMAAGKLGKIKTVCQMIFIMTALLEPILQHLISLIVSLPGWLAVYPPLTLATMAAAFVFTLWSGIDYFRGSGKYIDPEK